MLYFIFLVKAVPLLHPLPTQYLKLFRAFSVFSMNIVVLLYLFQPRAHSSETESLNLYVGTQTTYLDGSHGVRL